MRLGSEIFPVKLSQEELEKLEDLAACNYTLIQAANFFEIPKETFLQEYANTESLVFYHYNRGKLTADFNINEKLLEDAKGGNITAIQIYDNRKYATELENIKQRVLYGG